MKRITKQDFLDVINKDEREFRTEDEFEKYLKPKLIELFGIKESQFHSQVTTTQFDWNESNRADIVITDGNDPEHALIIIEVKLEKSVSEYNGNFGHAMKQLHKYCQQLRAPYGIVLTENRVSLWHYHYFFHDDIPENISNKGIPDLKQIEEKATLNAIGEAILQKHSLKYLYLIVFGSFFYVSFISWIAFTVLPRILDK